MDVAYLLILHYIHNMTTTVVRYASTVWYHPNNEDTATNLQNPP